MKILVTGGAGFVGANLCERLLNGHHDVYSIDNYSIGTEENHIKGIKYIKGDVTDISEIIKNDFDLCFHLAGLSRIQPSFENPFDTFHSNTLGTQKVLDWSRKNNTKVIYSGSSSKHHNPYQSPYALYKYLGEELCKMYKEVYKMEIQIVRFYNVYGPKEIVDGDWAALIGIWRRQVRDDHPLTIIGDGEQRRDFTHIVDIVDGIYKIGTNSEKHQDAWELGSGINYSINEIYTMFKEKFPQIKSIYLPDQPGNYRKTLRENDDVLERLGWEPKDRLKNYIQNL